MLLIPGLGRHRKVDFQDNLSLQSKFQDIQEYIDCAQKNAW